MVARYDRQRMARDIYVLLWTLSGGNDSQNYMQTVLDRPRTTRTPPASKPIRSTPDSGRTEAGPRDGAFAVNLVDAMDHDNVITRFEYDRNLTDGWQGTGGDMDVVYGIEQQQLAFSEVMFVVQPYVLSDLTLTYQGTNDADNLPGTVSPGSPISSSTSNCETQRVYVPLDDGSWRIGARPSGMSAVVANVRASVEFQGVAGSPRTYNRSHRARTSSSAATMDPSSMAAARRWGRLLRRH